MSLLQIEEPGGSKSEELDQELPILGIDLGTTNSLVGIMINGVPKFFRDEFGKDIHKSVVAFDGKGDVVAVGNSALETEEGYRVFSVKRLMGKGKGDELKWDGIEVLGDRRGDSCGRPLGDEGRATTRVDRTGDEGEYKSRRLSHEIPHQVRDDGRINGDDGGLPDGDYRLRGNDNGINKDSKENSNELKITIGQQEYLPEEISKFILRYLKELALKSLHLEDRKDEIIKAVITVPAYFDEGAKNATKMAAKLAGIEVIRLVNEPTAAALSYGLDGQKEGIYSVFDLGGGTFDVSVLKMSKGVFRVLGVSGNNQLGGDDFDVELSGLIERKVGESRGGVESQEIPHQVRDDEVAVRDGGLAVRDGEVAMRDGKIIEKKTDECRGDPCGRPPPDKNKKEKESERATTRVAPTRIKEIKERLSQQDEVEIDSKTKITRKEFEDAIEEKIDEAVNLTKELIDDLELEIGDEKNEILGIILVGGSSRIPLIHKKLHETFGEVRLFDDLDPDKVVAQGAVLQAFNLSGGGDQLLLDVLPLSLGVEMMGGVVDKIIHRNTTIPIAMAKEFTTYADNQTGMKLKIVQGEREFAQDCRELAEFEVKGIPAMKAGMAKVLVTFKVDADGLLTVTAREEFSGKEQEIIVKPSFGIGEDDVKEMLLDSLRNSKGDMERRLKAEAIREAKQNIAFLERDLKSYGELVSEEERKEIGATMLKLMGAINKKGNRRKEIEEEMKNLERVSENFVLRKMDEGLLKGYLGKKV